MRNLVDIEMNGANRGGDAYVNGMLPRLSKVGRRLRARVVDRDPERAEALAGVLQQEGVDAVAYAGGAQFNPYSRVWLEATDDPAMKLVPVTVTPSENQVVQLAFLCNVNTFGPQGGTILGVSSCMTRESDDVQQEAKGVIGTFTELAPHRQRSSNVTGRIFDTHADVATRKALYGDLAKRSLDFLTSGVVEPGTLLIDGITQKDYPTTAMGVDRNVSRRALTEIASRKILPESSFRERGAVAFYDHAWLYIVMARNSGNRWIVERRVELPVPMPVRTPIEIEPVGIPRWRKISGEVRNRLPKVFMTD